MKASDPELVTTASKQTAAANGTLAASGAAAMNRIAENGLATSREWLFPDGDELFRGIYTRAGITAAGEVVAISSAIAGEGKTTLSLGLAATVAQDFPDRRVLLVETDWQRPALAVDFDLDPEPGLLECLLTGHAIENAYRASFLDNLHLVPVGQPLAGPGRVLRSSRTAAAIDTMREQYDLVVLDTPAVLVNSDVLLLTDLVDAILFVVRAGVTPQSLVNKALEQLDETKLRGIVLNGAQTAVPNWLRRLCGM